MTLSSSAALLASALLSTAAPAVIVHVEITGTVEWNLFTSGPLAPARAGDPVRLAFDLDSNNFVNDPTWPVRSYPIIPSSWVMTAGAGTVGLRDPLPPDFVPYFMMRNNDPGVDGFVAAAPVNIPNMSLEFLRTFTSPNVWPSLDVLDALGSYGFELMSSYNFTIGRGEAYFFGAIYETISLTIDQLPCPADYNADGGVDGSDVEAFFRDWEDGNSAADVNQDGGVDGTDVEVFFIAWENGGC